MSMHRTIIRYYLIISKVRRPGYPSLEEIQEYLHDHDFSISTRTFSRDLENIRNEFGIEVTYDKFQKGYYIDESLSVEMSSLMKFMEMAVLTGTLSNLFRDTGMVRDYISFDSEGLIKGVEYISRILFALKHHRFVTIKYQKFIDDEPYVVMVKPGLLKEYQNRWYMLSMLSNGGEFRAFALDRIKGLKVEERVFPGSEIVGIRERFIHVLGISLSDENPTLVEITIDSQQWKYIEALPWHPSQEKVREKNETVTFRLFVVVNYELKEKILGEGNFVKSVKPEWLAKAVMKKRTEYSDKQ